MFSVFFRLHKYVSSLETKLNTLSTDGTRLSDLQGVSPRLPIYFFAINIGWNMNQGWGICMKKIYHMSIQSTYSIWSGHMV